MGFILSFIAKIAMGWLLPAVTGAAAIAVFFFKGVVRLVLIVVATVGLLLYIWHLGSVHGQAVVQSAWDKQTAAVVKAVDLTHVAQATVTSNVGNETKRSQDIIYLTGKTITKRIPQYVPTTLPLLPAGFRLVHDAAATGVLIPESASGAVGEPVSPQDVASTVSDNYAGCRANADLLDKWAEWAAKEAAVTNGNTTVKLDAVSPAQ